MSFADISHNERVIKILRLALSRGRVPNSMLFAGPDGSGKLIAALTVAKALNCLKLTDDSCDSCEPCRAIEADYAEFLGRKGGVAGETRLGPLITPDDNKKRKKQKPEKAERGRFPDLILIAPEGKKNVIKLSWIKELKATAYMRPMSGRKRVFIIDQAEKMNRESSNALLKVYEEPPLSTHFILVTSEPGLILPTIRSRCQYFIFAPRTKEEIVSHLIEQGVSPDVAEEFAPLIEVKFRRFLRVRKDDVDEMRNLRHKSWQYLSSLIGQEKRSVFLEAFWTVDSKQVEEIIICLELMAIFGRDLLFIKVGGNEAGLINQEYKTAIKNLAGHISLERIINFIKETDLLVSRLSGMFNKNLSMVKYFLSAGELSNV